MTDFEVIVIGAGPGGIAAGVLLKRANIEDFALLDRADDVGGSWRDNTYPGIGVDVPSLLYQYSFARHAGWSRVFPKGDEVHRYHADVVRRFGLDKHLRLNTTVVRERWDDDAHVWELETAEGGTLTARFVINAVGAFISPKDDPGIPGLKQFRGKLQRPTAWDHSYDHAGKRVGIVGTGASSVQITPAIAPEVGRLTVFQRTPVWCLPKPDAKIGPLARAALKVPGVQAGLSGVGLAGIELLLRTLVSTPTALARPALDAFDAATIKAYRAYLHGIVDDPDAAAALAPDYGPIGKRPTISNGYLRAFNRDNVALVTEPIERITRTGIKTADGTTHPLDMLVLATGYELFSDPESYRPQTIVGRDGFDLGEFYGEHGLQAYESVAVPGLPNRWMLVGPYSWTGTGWHALVEITAGHAVRAITTARRRGATAVEVKQAAHDAYHRRVKQRNRNVEYYLTERNGHVNSYYVNSQGDSTYIRPSSYFQARRASRHFPLEDYSWSSNRSTKSSSSGRGSAASAPA